MATYVNWDIGGLVEVQQGIDPRTNGPVLLITMSQSTYNHSNMQQIEYPADRLTEVEVALANKGFVAI
jgi:hypothetical protein